MYNAKFDVEVNITTPLYHLTPDISYRKIKLFGLTSKTKEKLATHPERIYLLNPTDEYEEIALELYDKEIKKIKDLIEHYYLLKIDTSLLNNKFQFYNDPRFSMGNGGVWCFENIPSKCISVVKKILVNPSYIPPTDFIIPK